MSNASRIAITILIAVRVVGCGLAKSRIGEIVEKSMQEKFNSDPQFKDWHLTVMRVQVLS